MKLPSYVGPHNDKELELMLAGKKPLAMFSKELGVDYQGHEEAFKPYVKNGQILLFKDMSKDGKIEQFYYCLPTEEWRAKTLRDMSIRWDEGTLPDTTSEDMIRLEGTLLGYSKKSIELFIKRSRRSLK